MQQTREVIPMFAAFSYLLMLHNKTALQHSSNEKGVRHTYIMWHFEQVSWCKILIELQIIDSKFLCINQHETWNIAVSKCGIAKRDNARNIRHYISTNILKKKHNGIKHVVSLYNMELIMDTDG